MNIPPEYLSAITLILAALISGGFAYWGVKEVQKNIKARVPYQNDKDRVDALKTAMEMAGMDLDEQLMLKKEVKELREIVSNTQIQITTVQTVFLDGQQPRAEIIKIEAVRVIRQQESSVV